MAASVMNHALAEEGEPACGRLDENAAPGWPTCWVPPTRVSQPAGRPLSPSQSDNTVHALYRDQVLLKDVPDPVATDP